MREVNKAAACTSGELNFFTDARGDFFAEEGDFFAEEGDFLPEGDFFAEGDFFRRGDFVAAFSAERGDLVDLGDFAEVATGESLDLFLEVFTPGGEGEEVSLTFFLFTGEGATKLCFRLLVGNEEEVTCGPF